MKKLLRSALVGTVVGTIGLAACDAGPPQKSAAPQPVPLEQIPPSGTLVDVVRNALANILRNPDPYARARELGTLLPTLGPEAVPAVAQTLADQMLDLRGAEIELLVRFWATYAPEDAANWAKKEAQLNFHNIAVFSAISAWAQVDPKAAQEHVWPWSEIDGIDRVVPVALSLGWFARNDPQEIRRLLYELPAGIPQQRALAAYVRALVQTQGAGAATAWAESIPDKQKDFKQAVYRRVVDAVALLDIAAARRWCETQCNGPYGSNMRNLISRNWVLRDGPAAMEWLSASPPGIERDIDVQLTWGLWSRVDPQPAREWLEPRLAGEGEEWVRRLIPIYAQLLAGTGDDPAKAMEWAQKTRDPQEREAVMVSIGRIWNDADPTAAEAWLAQSGLSEEAKARVRAPLPAILRPQRKQP